MARRKRKKAKEESSGPGWIVTFSDLMTLLLAFFVLLYSFSTMDAIKFKQVASSLQSVLLGEGKVTIFEDTPPGDKPLEKPEPDPNEDIDKDINDEFENMLILVQEHIKNEGLDAEVTVSSEERGILLDIKDSIMFQSGKAYLKSESLVVLDKLSRLLNKIPNEIIIEGHTDNVPMRSANFPSNWELSVVRSTTVVRYFIEKKGLKPERFTAAGYGKYRPIVPNDSPENKRLNRRVEFIIVIDEEGEVDIGSTK